MNQEVDIKKNTPQQNESVIINRLNSSTNANLLVFFWVCSSFASMTLDSVFFPNSPGFWFSFSIAQLLFFLPVMAIYWKYSITDISFATPIDQHEEKIIKILSTKHSDIGAYTFKVKNARRPLYMAEYRQLVFSGLSQSTDPSTASRQP